MGLKIKQTFTLRDCFGLWFGFFFYFGKWGKKRVECSTQLKHSSTPEARPSIPQYCKSPRATVDVVFNSEGSS